MAKNHRRAGENFNNITRAAPCKEEMLTEWRIWQNGDFECNVNKIRWVIPDWNIIKDFHWLLPHLENYLFSPNFSLTLNTLKNTTPQNLVYACPTRFVSFQQPDIKSNMVHLCFVLKTYIPLCKTWGPEYLQNVILYQSHLPFTSKVKQQYYPTLYKSIIITFHAMNPWLMVSICYCNIKWHILLFSVAKTFIFYYIQLPGGGGTLDFKWLGWSKDLFGFEIFDSGTAFTLFHDPSSKGPFCQVIQIVFSMLANLPFWNVTNLW